MRIVLVLVLDLLSGKLNYQTEDEDEDENENDFMPENLIATKELA